MDIKVEEEKKTNEKQSMNANIMKYWQKRALRNEMTQ